MQSLQTGNNRQPLTQGPRGTVNLHHLHHLHLHHLKNLHDHTDHYIHNHISDIVSYPKVHQPKSKHKSRISATHFPEKTSTPGIAKVTLIHQSCTAQTVLMLIGSAKNWPGFGGRNITQVRCFLLVPLVFVGSARNRSNVWYGCKPKAWEYKSPHKIGVFLLSLNQVNHII